MADEADDFGAGLSDGPVETPSVEHPAPVEERPPASVLVEKFRERGYALPNDIDDDALIEQLASSYEQVTALRPEVDEYRQKKADFEKWKAESNKPAPPAPKSKRPEISETAQRMIDAGLISIDQKTGLYASDDVRLEPYTREANEASQWQRKRAARLVESPFEAIREEGLDTYMEQKLSEVRSEYEAKLEAKLAALQHQSSLNSFWEKNGAEYFQTDANGNVQYAGGQPLLNERGKAYQDARREATEKYGIADPIKAHELAVKLSAGVKTPQPKGRTVSEKVQSYRTTNRLNGTRKVAKAIENQADEDLDIGKMWDEESHLLR